jgi:hypothetical protein
MLRRALWAAAFAATLPAQSIVPARAGLVSYADEAYIDDRLLEISTTHFSRIHENGVLRTGAGRAEVLLGPCSAMWVDENSSFRLISDALSDVRLEVLSGSVVVFAGAMVKGARMTVLLKTSIAPLDSKGAYHFDAMPARIKVLAGRTAVQWDNRTTALTASRLLVLEGAADVIKFDRRSTDALESWSYARAAHLAHMAAEQRWSGPDHSAAADPAASRGPLAPNRAGNTPAPPLPEANPPVIAPAAGCRVEPW